MTAAGPVLLDIGKAIIGSFAGATFAFIFALRMYNRQLRRENKAAGNLAMATLRRQYNDFMVYGRGVKKTYDDMFRVEPHAPLWLLLKPHHYTFSGPLRFDIKSLTFLFEKGDVKFLQDLLLAEARYHDLMSSADKLNQTLDEAQQVLAAAGIGAQGAHRIGELENIVGPALVGRANSFVESMLRTVEEDKGVYSEATESLRAKLVEYFGADEKGILLAQAPGQPEAGVKQQPPPPH